NLPIDKSHYISDQQGFADLLFDCYRHILSSMRKILSDGDLTEAEALLTPE
ncbi:hypothetical protein HMPREF1548_02643, partial [Clostridium sp. KLE 1755]